MVVSLADEGADSIGREHDFGGGPAHDAIEAGHKLLGDNGEQSQRQLLADLRLVGGRKRVQDAGDGLDGVVGVEGGKDQVAGFGGGERGGDGFGVAHFSRVGAAFLDTIRNAASGYAAGELPANEGIVETRAGAQGTRNELIADVTPYSSGSDHDDYDSSTIAVPSLYLRDWPDIYIHTDHDSLDQIDATKLRRVALLGAASGYVYASLGPQQIPGLLPFLVARAEGRIAQAFSEALQLADDPKTEAGVAWYEARNLLHQTLQRERAMLLSLVDLTGNTRDAEAEAVIALVDQTAGLQRSIDARARLRGAKGNAPDPPWAADSGAKRVFVRVGEFGPLTYQNDNVLLARLGKERYAKIKLINSEATQMLNVRDQSELYAYEIVNFVDGRRSIGEIRDAVSAEYGPLPVSLVADYLDACAEAGVMQWK